MMRSIVLAAELVCSVAEHQVAGFRGGQRKADRLQVAHLADQDVVRVLAQRGAQRVRRTTACGARPRAG